MREEMDIRNSFFETCKGGDIEKIKLLLEKGANIEAKDSYGNTPLVWASWSGYIEVVKLLIEKGADIEVKNNYGFTPLIWASQNGRIEVVKLLVEKGADIEAKDINGETFYSYLEGENQKEIDLFLEDIEERKRIIKPCSFLATLHIAKK